MVEMPVVIEPNEVENSPSPDIPRAFLHIANSPIVVNILQCGPEKAEAAQHGDVMKNRNFEEIYHQTMHQKDQHGLKPHSAEILWIECLLKGSGRAIHVRF